MLPLACGDAGTTTEPGTSGAPTTGGPASGEAPTGGAPTTSDVTTSAPTDMPQASVTLAVGVLSSRPDTVTGGDALIEVRSGRPRLPCFQPDPSRHVGA